MKRVVKTITKLTCATTLCVFAAQTYAADNNINVSPAERAKIEQVVHQYLVNKPQVLMEAMQSLQQKQYAEAEESVKKTQQIASSYAKDLFKQAGNPVLGNPDGKVTVVEFFDYQCPHCVDMAPVMESIIKTNPDLRVVYKDFPIRGPLSDFAARAALAANLQGKYAELSHAILMSKQPITEESIIALAKDKGLDIEKLKADMNGSEVNKQIKATIQLARDLKLFGTPAIFIGKTDASKNDKIVYVPGQMQQQQLQAAIDATSKA